MWDDAQQPGKNATNRLITTFTQGLRDLPTDAVTRVKNFLLEYLGHPQQPVPFGGRSRDFASLDSWLEDTQAEPYLLIAAPAGRGKSALLLRWCQQLVTRQTLAIAYFPVSIRFRTNLAGVTFPALTALLASLHSEHIPEDPNVSEEVWRGLLAAYLVRPLPTGKRLLLVLDGVDEAADWSADTQLFPPTPPPGLRIVISARSLANDDGNQTWLQRLGWDSAGLARTLELSPLDRPGIANVLVQMGFPLDLLSQRNEMISELYRLSEGDPLLVRLYVDELWQRGEQAVQFTTTDLRAIQPGLTGYFELWWKDQRQLWGPDAPQREAAMQTMLNLLACALGPLSKTDLISLTAGLENFQAAELDLHLAPLARFVTGDGTHQGYVFSHPRLGNYFYEERLQPDERQAVELRFLQWGELALRLLNTGLLVPQATSPYIIQYYGVHLARAHAPAAKLLTLVSNGWRRAWETLDRAQAGFLGDVERARRAAEQEDKAAIASASAPPYLGAEVRCLLCQVSVNSMTNSISPRLMTEAVKTGVWTPAQGLACIRLLHDLAPRALELVSLATYVQEPLRTDILHEALDTAMAIKDDYLRFDALLALAHGLPAELLAHILDSIQEFADEADRGGMLAELAPFISPYPDLFERFMLMVQAFEEEEYQALAFTGMAATPLPANLQASLLASIQFLQEERYRVQALLALIPHLPEEALQQVAQQAEAVQDGLLRMRLLAELAIHLPATDILQETLKLEREIEDRDYRVELLVKLAPLLPVDKLQYTLQEINYLWDERARASALTALVPTMPDELLPALLQAILELKNEEERSNVLLPLLPRLSQDMLEKVLDCANVTWDEGCRATLLAQLGSSIPEALLPQLLEAILTIKDPGYRVWLLAELEAPLQDKLATSAFNLPATFQAMSGREERLQTLLAIAPRLSNAALARLFEFMLKEIFYFAWYSRSEEEQTHILTKLGGRLPLTQIQRALETVQSFLNEANQAQVLQVLAPQLDGRLLSVALAIVRNMQEPEKRAQVLEALVETLPVEQKSARIQEMIQVLQIIKDEATRAHLIHASAPFLHTQLAPQVERTVLQATGAMLDEGHQARILQTFAPHGQPKTYPEVLTMAANMLKEDARAMTLEALAPSIPAEDLPIFLSSVHKLQNSHWRVQILVKRAVIASDAELAQLLDTALTTQDAKWRGNLLEMLIPRAPEDALTRIWEAVLAPNSITEQMRLFNLLVPRMPDDFFPALWTTFVTNTDDNQAMWILRTLAPNLSPTLFMHTWEATLQIKKAETRTEMLAILAPHAPTSYFKQVWDMLPKLFSSYTYWHVLENLAERVPATELYAFFTAIETVSEEYLQVEILVKLLPHALEILQPQITAAFFEQIWQHLLKLHSATLQARLLIPLLPYLPQALLAGVWEIYDQIDDLGLRLAVLKALIPLMTQEQLAEIQRDVLRVGSAQQRLEIIEVLVNYLAAEACEQLLQKLLSAQSIQTYLQESSQFPGEKHWQIHIITLLVNHLPAQPKADFSTQLLNLQAKLRPEEEQAWVLTALAPTLAEDLYQPMLQTLWSLQSTHHQDQILAALQAALTPTGWSQLLELTVERMRATDDPQVVVQLFKQAPAWIAQTTTTVLYPVLLETLHLLARQPRREALYALAVLMPAINQSGGETAVLAAGSSMLEVGLWWP